MHKILPILVILGVLIVAVPFFNGFKSKNITEGSVEGAKTELQGKSNTQNKYLEKSIEKLQEVEVKTKNEEEKNRIKEVLQETVKTEENIDTHISSMEARPSYVKFIMGPDYKNAGQVRSEIVHLRNDISKLDRIQEKTGATDSGTLAETKNTLSAELEAIETKLYNSLQGFSLFGWLSKLLTGFTPAATPTPSFSPSPSLVPSVTPEATSTPITTSSPTIQPTVVPTPTP